MPKLTGGQALIKQMYREGARVVFGMPGIQMYDAMDAIYGEPGLRFITVRHEQAATYMAYGYSRASGEIGTALVVPGPGLQNAAAGIGTAYAASTPILVFAGQIRRADIGRELGELHEIHEQMDTVRPVTKWTGRALHARDVPRMVNEAYHLMNDGRPRPVEIEVPWDTLGEVEDVELFEPAKHQPLAPPAESIARAAEVLASSQRPIIWAGGGVDSADASGALDALAEVLEAPVVSTPEGKGAISDRHRLSMGVPYYRSDPINGLIEDADLLLAVGTRLERSRYDLTKKVVHVDVDPHEIAKVYADTIGVLGDARLSMDALGQAISSTHPPRPSRQKEIEDIKAARRRMADRSQPQAGFVDAIRAALPDDGIVVSGITQVGYGADSWLPVYHPRTYITSSYYGNLGYAFPTALGAKVAMPERAVVAISGDGGFLYNSQELATAVKYGINAVAIVFNDNAYGNVLRDQRNLYEGRTIGSELHNPDFVKLAEAYGAKGVRVAGGPEDLEAALAEALSDDTPAVIEVPVGGMERPA